MVVLIHAPAQEDLGLYLHINNILTKNTARHLLPLPHDPVKRLNGGQVGAKKNSFPL